MPRYIQNDSHKKEKDSQGISILAGDQAQFSIAKLATITSLFSLVITIFSYQSVFSFLNEFRIS